MPGEVMGLPNFFCSMTPTIARMKRAARMLKHPAALTTPNLDWRLEMANANSSGTLPPLPPEQNCIEYRHVPGIIGWCVGSDGSAWSCKPKNGRGMWKLPWRRLATKLNRKGYLELGSNLIHHLILISFAGERPNEEVGRHLNGIKTDNRPINLAWGSRKDNADDAKRNGRTLLGEDSRSAKLTESQVLEIRRRRAGGERGANLAREFGVTSPTICAIFKRRKWRHI
jgi:hypothetical protein